MKVYEEKYEICEAGKTEGAVRNSIKYQAKVEIALRRFLEKGGYTAFTTNFQVLHGMKQLPGLAVQRLMEDGYGFGGEGDWKTAGLVRLIPSSQREQELMKNQRIERLSAFFP